MPTPESRPLLDRARATEDAKPLIDLACPLLVEILNYGCRAWEWCNQEGSRIGGENEDVAAMTLYRHLLEQIDGVEVLLRSSCSEALVPVLRASFETSLSLQFIFSDNYTQRSLPWLCAYLHGRIARHRISDPRTSQGAEFLRAVGDLAGRPGHASLPGHHDSAPAITDLQSVLARNELKPIEAEFQRLMSRRKGRPPQWFQLFDGPNHRRVLAKAVGSEAEYLALYPPWSSSSHGTDASAYLRTSEEPNRPAFLALRSPNEFQMRAWLAAAFMLRAIRLTVGHFRPDLSSDVRQWYAQEIKAGWDELRNVQVVLHETEEPPREGRKSVRESDV